MRLCKSQTCSHDQEQKKCHKMLQASLMSEFMVSIAAMTRIPTSNTCSMMNAYITCRHDPVRLGLRLCTEGKDLGALNLHDHSHQSKGFGV